MKKLCLIMIISFALLSYGQKYQPIAIIQLYNRENFDLKSSFPALKDFESLLKEEKVDTYIKYKMLESYVKEFGKEISLGLFISNEDKKNFLGKIEVKKNRVEQMDFYISMLFNPVKDHYELKKEYREFLKDVLDRGMIYVTFSKKGTYIFSDSLDVLKDEKVNEII